MVYPLRNTFSPPSHFLKTQSVKEKNSHLDPGGVFTPAFTLACFFAHVPVRALYVLTDGPFFVSTHVNDPTTGVEVDFDEERLTKRFVGLVFGWDGQYVVGYGLWISVRWGW